jgi:signal transduction histidine kinase
LREDVPLEVQPLVRELNQFIDAWRNHLQRSRQSLGNLAHALKSPLNLILLHHAESIEDPVAKQAIRMRGLIDRVHGGQVSFARSKHLGGFAASVELPGP